MTTMMCEAGVDLILVGDSLGMVIQGHDSTVPVSMEDILYHLRCVKNGNSNAHIMADMPFMSYATEQLAYTQCDSTDARRSKQHQSRRGRGDS